MTYAVGDISKKNYYSVYDHVSHKIHVLSVANTLKLECVCVYNINHDKFLFSFLTMITCIINLLVPTCIVVLHLVTKVKKEEGNL